MQITEIRCSRVNSENKIKAIASVVFDDSLVVNDIKVIESATGLFVAMPSRRTPDGGFKDVAHPINSETREYIQTVVLEEYNNLKD